MSEEIAIKVNHISKTFKLPHEKQNSLKGALIGIVKGGNRSYEKQQVLDDISFDIKKGEFFGIVGRNGSGKSTLLKMLAGIYVPSKGGIHVNGKLTPFIELGVGFNPELTGRENVFLNGALLGFNRSEMNAMYDDIVAFAEISQFMDQKLKNYSSGMQVRLAFSIAIRAKSDILVLDEVLAVGDEAFQRKCLDVFERYKADKQTVVLVTHDMLTVKKYCTRAILINQGKLEAEGNPHDVADAYSKLNYDGVDDYTTSSNTKQNTDFEIGLVDKSGKPKVRFWTNEQLTVKLMWSANKPVRNAGVSIYTSTGECVFATNTFIDTIAVEANHLQYKVELNLGSGRYYIMAGTFGKTQLDVIDFVSHGPEFTIEEKGVDAGEGVVRLVHQWEQ